MVSRLLRSIACNAVTAPRRAPIVRSYKLQAASYKLQVTRYKLQVTSYKLQATSGRQAAEAARVMDDLERNAELVAAERALNELQVTSYKLQVTSYKRLAVSAHASTRLRLGQRPPGRNKPGDQQVTSYK